MQSQNISVGIENVVKRYGSFTALHNVSLSIRENEFFTLLGPSGCGKTTLLRCIAGFEEVTEGRILLNNEDLTGLQAFERPINTVFQQYALFPHLTVEENVMFGLLRSGSKKQEAKSRTAEMLELVQLESFAKRKSSQLSGGQQQRVALARALAPKPKVLLLDEPLSALDLKLRQSVRIQLKEIQKETGISFIFVTHDQEEALTMSDRIAVMSEGFVQQIGTPREIYESPANRFVANFIGETNLLEVDVVAIDGEFAKLALPGGKEFSYSVNSSNKYSTNNAINNTAENKIEISKYHLSIRPERISFTSVTEGDLEAKVIDQIYLGTDIQVQLKLSNAELVVVRLQNSESISIPDGGERVGLKLEAGAISLLRD